MHRVGCGACCRTSGWRGRGPLRERECCTDWLWRCCVRWWTQGRPRHATSMFGVRGNVIAIPLYVINRIVHPKRPFRPSVVPARVVPGVVRALVLLIARCGQPDRVWGVVQIELRCAACDSEARGTDRTPVVPRVLQCWCGRRRRVAIQNAHRVAEHAVQPTAARARS